MVRGRVAEEWVVGFAVGLAVGRVVVEEGQQLQRPQGLRGSRHQSQIHHRRPCRRDIRVSEMKR